MPTPTTPPADLVPCPVAPLSESRRRRYLQILGVDRLRARSPLPGAATSAQAAAAAPVSTLVSALVSIPVSAPASAARAALQAGARTSTPVTTPTPSLITQASSPPPVAAAMTAAVVSARFSVMLVAINASHAALIDLDNQPGLEGAEANLWAALCAAFDWQWPARATPAQFLWPIPGLPATVTAGEEALTAWLHTHCPQPCALVVFGETLAAYTPSAQQVLPSLPRLLAQPLLKRELMLALKLPL